MQKTQEKEGFRERAIDALKKTIGALLIILLLCLWATAYWLEFLPSAMLAIARNKRERRVWLSPLVWRPVDPIGEWAFGPQWKGEFQGGDLQNW